MAEQPDAGRPALPAAGPSALAVDAAGRFSDFLQSRGMRSTRQRRIMLELAFAEARPFDADQLLERIAAGEGSGNVSRPTVYRTLGEFVEAGLLRTLELGGRTVYEPVASPVPADHMHCTGCQSLTGFQSESILAALREIAAKHRFQLQRHRLVLEGLCAECRVQRKRERRPVDLI